MSESTSLGVEGYVPKAYIDDEYDPDRPETLGNSFVGHVQRRDLAGVWDFETAPRGLDLAEALEWARGRAPRVVLTIGGRQFSVGDQRIDDLPDWGPQSLATLDPVTESPFPWRVRVFAPDAATGPEVQDRLRGMATARRVKLIDGWVVATVSAVGPRTAEREVRRVLGDRFAELPVDVPFPPYASY